MSPDLAAEVAKVLAAHMPTAWDEASLTWLHATYCDCGAGPFGLADDEEVWQPAHRAHVAAEVTNTLVAALEPLRALADDFRSNVDWSSGRSNYGDNAAWESAARQLDDALTEALGAGEVDRG